VNEKLTAAGRVGNAYYTYKQSQEAIAKATDPGVKEDEQVAAGQEFEAAVGTVPESAHRLARWLNAAAFTETDADFYGPFGGLPKDYE
jgi:hypothetical protein